MSWWKRIRNKENPASDLYAIPSGLSEQDQKLHAMRIKRIMDEIAEAERHGHKFLLMHFSALSPSTRLSHAERHGKLYTPSEMLEWWNRDGNASCCKCSAIPVLLDDDGAPIVPAVVERAHQTYEKMKAKGKGEWTQD